MSFQDIFTKYWDSLIIGIIAGLVLYKGLEIGNAWDTAIYIFTRGLFLILIYSTFVWLEKKYNLDKRFIEFFKNFLKNICIQQFNKSFFINSCFFILSVVIFSIVTLFLNGSKLLHPLMLVLSILVSSIISFLLYLFQKSSHKNFLNTISLFLFFITLFTILSTIYISIPFEQKGINIEPLEAEFNFYIVNNEISKEDLLYYLLESNKIWNKYNISILSNGIYNVEINLTREERYLLYSNISGANSDGENERICNEEYMPIINKITNNSPNMSIIFIEGEGNVGRGSLCGHSFAIFRHEKLSLWEFTLIDWTGRNLAHEIGHILGLIHPESLYNVNLMNDAHKPFYRSYFLTQKQVDIIINKTKTINQ